MELSNLNYYNVQGLASPRRRLRFAAPRDDSMPQIKKTGAILGKVIIALVLAALVGAAFLWMSQEQQARQAAQGIYDALEAALDDSLTDADVHDRLGRQPNVIREPFRKRLVEEYTFKGPFQEHTVYAYYSVAAAKILEAVTINQISETWEAPE